MIEVSIPTTTSVNDYLLYNLEIQVTKTMSDTYKVSKRYSDFVEFKKSLETSLNSSIPYTLPSKYTNFYKSSEKIIDERKLGLTDFLSGILNDINLRSHDVVLNFLNLPRTTFVELAEDNLTKRNNFLNSSTEEEIDSSSKWLDNIRDVKSLLQDVRSKMFTNANIIGCKKSLDSSKHRIDHLKSYLSQTQELGHGEINRRKDLLNQLIRDYEELSSLFTGLSLTTINKTPLNTNKNTQRQQDEQFRSTSTRRTLGKPKETHITQTMDNKQLLQQQQLTLSKQDQDLDGLRSIIQRQRQIGTAINEELGIQNDLLNGLRDQVDQSEQKIAVAKRKIGRIL